MKPKNDWTVRYILIAAGITGVLALGLLEGQDPQNKEMRYTNEVRK